MAGKKSKNRFKDSDADGLLDGDERILHTNPKKADSDNDGVGDYEEVNIYGTDPLNPDTDDDGMKDGEEIKKGRNPKGPGLLKDLFIPHAGNDFQPRALHPYRLLFYALSSILFKVILIGVVITLPVEAWLTPDIFIEQSRKIIELTNAIRKNLNLAGLKENASLSQAAFDKVQDMLLKQYFAHIGPDNKGLANWLAKIKYNYAMAGENLAMGFSGPEEVVKGWSSSPTHYQNMVDPDFKEIGVGLTSGLYHKVDTTLVAQFFAAPAVSMIRSESVKVAAGQTALPRANNQLIAGARQGEQILGEKTEEKSAPAAELTAAGRPLVAEPPLIDLVRSKLYIDQPPGQSNLIVRAQVYLSPDAVKARVTFDDYFINLKPAEEPGEWTGQTLIFREKGEPAFNPIVLAAVTAEDRDGNRTTVDLEWANLKPANTTALEQYFFIKQHQSPYVKPLFDITAAFYKIVLVMALIALSLNILIEIRRQYPHVILSALGLIALLVFLISV